MKMIMPGNQQGLQALKKYWLNIIGAINPVNFEPTIMLTEENCCAELIEAFLTEIKHRYFKATCICIILDNARYQRSYLLQQK